MIETPSADQFIHGHLSRSLARFWEVGTGHDVFVSGIAALDALLAAASTTDRLYAADPRTCIQLATAIERAAPVMAAHFPALVDDRVHLLASQTAVLLCENDEALHTDRVLYAALLRMELAAEACRREIAARGDPLPWVIAFNRALAAPRPSDSHALH